jgi:glycosyltransferase involved in cell wall biosynthesis
VRVLINTQAASGPRTGVGHYTAELVRALSIADASVLRPYPTPWEARVTDWYERQSARFEARRGWIRRGALALARRAGACSYTDRLSRVAAHERIDLYHEPFFLPLPCDAPTVATVHDLSVLLHPEWHRPETVALFEERFAAGLKRCCHLVAISEFGKSEIVQHLGWPADRVSVTYMGVRPGLRRAEGAKLAHGLRALGLTAGYLLHVGTLEPRKNVSMLLRAYTALSASLRAKHPLVLVGGAGWNSDDVHAFLAGPGRAANVRWLGYVRDEHFAALYSGARALVFPTLYEGFGIPTIEMLACGGAVLASTAGAVAETAGASAHLIDPHDEPTWRAALARVLTDDAWWKELKRGAEEAAHPFSWARCAEQTLAAYRKALGQEEEVKRAA